jgi:hypothetical protein
MTACPRSLASRDYCPFATHPQLLHALSNLHAALARPTGNRPCAALQQLATGPPRKTVTAGLRFGRKLLIAHAPFDLQLGKSDE